MNGAAGRRVGALAFLLVAATTSAGAQHDGPRAYLLNVGVWSDSGVAGEAGVWDRQRIRLMVAPGIGPWRLDAAWETFGTLSSRRGGGRIDGALAEATSQAWLPLQGTLLSGAHGTWRHRADRLALRYTTSRTEVTAGRQAISWATTLRLTPADPFAPFDPSDPFREYRAGVDALRLRVTPGAFTEVDGAVRMADLLEGDRAIAAVRVRTLLRGVELSGWGGSVYGEAAGALGVTMTAHGAVMRGEMELRHTGGATIFRGAVGVDRSWEVAGRTLYLGVEYQRDDFGASAAAELPAVALSAPAARGEVQLLGRDEMAVQGTFQLHPLVALELFGLVNLDDQSLLLTPAATWSASGTVTVRGGAFLGFGPSGTALAPRSEYGLVPLTLYASAAAFF